jgi:ribosomal protein S14
MECAVCETDDISRLVNINCGKSSCQIIYDTHAYFALGHPVCRKCLRNWAKERAKTNDPSLRSAGTFIVDCIHCRNWEEFRDIIKMPSFEHIVRSR